MNKTRTRLLAGLLCMVLIFADVMPTGLVAQAAELMQQPSVESEVGRGNALTQEECLDEEENNVSEDETSEEEDNPEVSGNDESEEEESTPSEETPSEDTTDDETEEQKPSEEQADPEDGENGEETETPEEETPEEAEDPDISLLEEGESVEILESETAAVVDGEGNIIAKGTYPENAEDGFGTEWVLYENGKLVVTGKGDIKESYSASPWHEYCDKIITAVVSVEGMTDASHLFKDCSNLKSVSISDISEVRNMVNMFFGCSSLTEIDVSDWNTSQATNMGSMFSGCSSLIELDVSDWDTSQVKSMSSMFYGCSSLTKLDVSDWNTGAVYNMSYMFFRCSSLEELNVSKWNTGEVTNMNSMFRMPNFGSSLTALNVSDWNTQNVTDMHSMFYECSKLPELDVSGWNTGAVTDMSYMFYGCRSLTELNLGGWTTNEVTNMSGMFQQCRKLEKLDVNGWNTNAVTDMSCIVLYCSSLTELDLSGWNVDKVEKADKFFEDCKSLETIYSPINLKIKVSLPSDVWYRNDTGAKVAELPKDEEKSVLLTKNSEAISGSYKIGGSDTTWTLDANGKLTVTGNGEVKASANPAPWHEHCNKIITAKISVTGMTDASGLFKYCSNLKSVSISDTSKVTNMDSMFSGCSSLTELDVSDWNTREVTYMGSMFSGCSSLTKLDVSDWNTSEVTNMSSMFSGCKSLTELDVSDWDTGKVVYMGRMFMMPYEIGGSLTALDISKWNTSRVIDMNNMFLECSKLTELDVSGWNTGAVTDMHNMFYGCRSLTELNLSGWTTDSVTNMSGMFWHCSNLTKVDLNGWNTGAVKDMSHMFYGCNSLTKLDLSSWNTGLVEDMSSMFDSCSSLKELDLIGWNTGSVKNMEYMFYADSNLERVVVNGWNTGAVENMKMLFGFCSKLSDLDLSDWDIRSVKEASGMLEYCYGLETIYTPHNITASVILPGTKNKDFWYRADTREKLKTLELPKGEEKSVLLIKNKQPDEGSFITAKKKKTSYMVGNTVKVDDLTVTYYGSDGIVKTLSSSEYSTNINSVNESMSTTGDKTLTVTYKEPETDKELTADIILNVILGLTGENTTISLSDEDEIVYDGYPHEPKLTVTVRLEAAEDTGGTGDAGSLDDADNQADAAQESETQIILTAGEDYTVSYKNNVNAAKKDGDKAPTVTITGKGDYEGTLSEEFTIEKATLTIKVKDVNLAKGVRVSKPKEFDYEIKGLADVDKSKDDLVKIASYTFKKSSSGGEDSEGEVVEWKDIDISKTTSESDTRYYIIPNVGIDSKVDAKAGNNYVINPDEEAIRGELIIMEEQVMYTVSFDMGGHDNLKVTGTDEAINIPSVTTIAGSVITQTDSLRKLTEGTVAEEALVDGKKVSYVFAGWYKNTTFATKQKWNFDTDTVQADTTLYACWLEKGSDGDTGLQFSIQNIQDQTYTGSAIKPTVYVYAADGRTLLKSGKDYTIKYVNNTLVALEADGTRKKNGGTAYATNSGEQLKNIDENNKFDSKMPHVIITGKGNYSATIYKNFNILPADISADDGSKSKTVAAGFTLKYSDQLVTNTKKAQNPFSSLKYKKAMKLGTDFTITLKAGDDVKYDATKVEEDKKWSDNGNSATTEKSADGKKYIAPTIPKGYYGTFTMEVKGVNNYTGTFTKKVMVADKNQLMKNASISLGKNLKNKNYNNGKEVLLTPGYMVTSGKTKVYYKVEGGSVSSEPEPNGNDVFTVKAGKTYLIGGRGKDYTVSYTNNTAVGTATMTITGNPDKGYYGSKSVTFKIKGAAFNTKNIGVEPYNDGSSKDTGFRTAMTYTGKAVTQNKVALKTKDGKLLTYGKHYTISYKNNIKKGTATMTFTAKPESGYTGSIKKTFKITAQSLLDVIPDTNRIDTTTIGSGDSQTKRLKVRESVAYVKGGVKPSDRIVLTNSESITLKEGTDYTVKYKNNAAVTTSEMAENKKPYMTITGKGNYTGTLTVYFEIVPAELTEEQVIVTPTVLSTKDSYEYKPSVKVVDLVSSKTLSAGENKDYYIVEYKNNSQENVKKYVDGDTNALQPQVVIKAAASGCYKLADGVSEITVPLPIYETKLTSSNLYVVISEETYTGAQIKPKKVDVYVGEPTGVKQAIKDEETNESILTKKDGTYKLTKLEPKTEAGGDYIVTYGANVTAGKNKGSVTVTGVSKKYGGSVTVKFNIAPRQVFYKAETP